MTGTAAATLARLDAAIAGRYRLREEVGRGGMATVYCADDLKHARTVAIKVLRPELVQGGDERARFLREIRIAAALSHPAILPLHDSGDADGLLWYVMPFVKGESLRQRLLAVGRLPEEEAIAITTTVAQALDYAHRENVIHRDIKPENILLYEGHAVVADFGIARAITVAATDNVTERGLAIGTPAYMSPEQIGAEREIDGRTDIYALGCVLHEMLTGSPPFAAEAGGRPVILRHLSDPPRPLREVRPTVSATVERAVLTALAKDPAERFARAGDLAAALVTRTAEPARVARGDRLLAVLPFRNASAQPDTEYLSDGITDELITALSEVPGLQVCPRSAVFALRESGVSGSAAGHQLHAQLVLEGSVRRAGDRLRITVQLTDVAEARLVWSERFDREMGDIFALEEEVARTIVSVLRSRFLHDLADPVPRRYTESVDAYHLYLRGRYAWNRRTNADTLEAIRLFEQALTIDPGYALAHTGLSDSYALQVDYRGAPVMEGLALARAEAEKALQLDSGLAEAHTSLAWVTFIHDWDWEKAGREFTRAIALNPRYASGRQWHAWYMMAMGRLDDAIAEARLAVELDPTSVSIRRSLGWLHLYARRADEAVRLLRHAVTLNPTSDESLWVLGCALMEAGQFAEADVVLRESESLTTADFHAFATLGRLAVRRGDLAEARRRLAVLEATARERYVSPVDFIRLSLAVGDHDAAFHWIGKAHEERRGWMVYLRVDPMLDPVRHDPRFTEWLRRMRLE